MSKRVGDQRRSGRANARLLVVILAVDLKAVQVAVGDWDHIGEVGNLCWRENRHAAVPQKFLSGVPTTDDEAVDLPRTEDGSIRVIGRHIEAARDDPLSAKRTRRLEQNTRPSGGAGRFESMLDRISVRTVCGSQVTGAFHRTRTVPTGDVEQFWNIRTDDRFESSVEGVQDRPLRERATFQ